ncbi:MAG: DNA gyrase inhibitor YacG [Phycisphaerae bacterium]|nr:DNA gyrase inhibitor YacG [Phycisphaerae bacterium]
MRDPSPREPDGPEPSRRFVCPSCKRPVNRPADGSSGLPRFFPFCSERCKLIDLGAWFDADYRIPAKPDEESNESPDAGADAGRRTHGQ